MAGKGKKTFVAGEVLLAQDVNDYLMDQSVMNFASSAARSSAIPTPTTGMVSYVGDTGSDSATNATIVDVPQIQAYTGSAWQNMDGLTLVAKATIGTTVSAVTVTDAFSATYENYKIVVSGGVGSANLAINLTLGATTTGYYYGGSNQQYGSSTISPNVASNVGGFLSAVYGSVNGLSGTIELENPFATKRTVAKWQATGTSTNYFRNDAQGFLDNNTSYTAFTLTTASGTITGGTIYVYGYRSA
jgi:hypothetical protein